MTITCLILLLDSLNLRSGCFRPSWATQQKWLPPPPQPDAWYSPVHYFYVYFFTGHHTVRMHLFLSNVVETTLWQRSPPYTLSSTLPGCERIWRNMCSVLSSGHLKLLFCLSLQWELNFQMVITHLILLWDLMNWLRTWMF